MYSCRILHVVTGFKLLNFPTLALDELFDNESCDGVGRISLLSVGLYYNTAIYHGFVFLLVLGCVIGM